MLTAEENVTDPVAHMVVALGVILMDGVTLWITDTDNELDVSFVGEAQASEEVSTQVMFTVLPKFTELITKVEDVAPNMDTLFRNHW